MNMEANHAKVMFDIEVHKSRQAKNELTLQEINEKAKAREKEVEELEEKLEKKATMQMRKQRELDIVMKKYLALKETCDVSLILVTLSKHIFCNVSIHRRESWRLWRLASESPTFRSRYLHFILIKTRPYPLIRYLWHHESSI